MYNDVSFVKIKSEKDYKDRDQLIWEIHYKDGDVSDIDPGDLWEINSSEIVKLLTEYGVEFK